MTCEKMREAGADCKSCPLFVSDKQNKPVMPAVPKGTPLGVVVNESPSADDMIAGRPLVGPTGREFDVALKQAGLRRDELVIINAIACRPGPLHGPDARNAAAKACRPALKKFLEPYYHLPKLLAGHASTAAFMKVRKGGVPNMRGFIREEENAVVTFRPSYAFFTNPYSWASFESDLRQFSRLVVGHAGSGVLSITTEPTVEALRRVVAAGRGVVGVDIETTPTGEDQPWTGLDPTRAGLRSVQIGNEVEAVSFIWDKASGPVQREVRDILKDPEVTKVFCNGPFFDIRILKRYGLDVLNWEDVRDLRCALSATSELSLRYMGSIYCPELGAWKELGMDDDDK